MSPPRKERAETWAHLPATETPTNPWRSATDRARPRPATICCLARPSRRRSRRVLLPGRRAAASALLLAPPSLLPWTQKSLAILLSGQYVWQNRRGRQMCTICLPRRFYKLFSGDFRTSHPRSHLNPRPTRGTQIDVFSGVFRPVFGPPFSEIPRGPRLSESIHGNITQVVTGERVTIFDKIIRKVGVTPIITTEGRPFTSQQPDLWRIFMTTILVAPEAESESAFRNDDASPASRVLHPLREDLPESLGGPLLRPCGGRMNIVFACSVAS